jgi:hypothetical protein
MVSRRSSTSDGRAIDAGFHKVSQRTGHHIDDVRVSRVINGRLQAQCAQSVDLEFQRLIVASAEEVGSGGRPAVAVGFPKRGAKARRV